MEPTQVSMAISLGSLAAIVYTLRTLIMLDRKVSKIMKHQGINEN